MYIMYFSHEINPESMFRTLDLRKVECLRYQNGENWDHIRIL